MAATESNRRRPLRPLRTGIQATIIRPRENRVRTVKSSPRGVIPGQLCRNGPTKQGHVLSKPLQARHRLSEIAVAKCVIADVVLFFTTGIKRHSMISSGGLSHKSRLVFSKGHRGQSKFFRLQRTTPIGSVSKISLTNVCRIKRF